MRRAALLALAFIVVGGIALRLHDPWRDPWLGAEDPWMHGVYVEIHLDAGAFSRERVHGPSVYPPGLHALLGALVSGAGLGFEDLARLLPALFGGLSIAGAFVAGARLASPRAGLAAAAVLAVTPEHLVRTNLLFPAALDLALLPWLVLAVVEARHDLRWAAVAGAVALALLSAHPWIFALLVPMGVVWGALEAFAKTRPRALAMSLAAPAAVAALVPAWMAFGRFWTLSSERVADGVTRASSLLAAAQPALLVGAALGVGAAWTARRVRRRWALAPAGALLIITTVTGLAFVAGPTPAFLVDYPAMLGWVAPVAAALGLAAAVRTRGPLWRLGAAIVLVTFPLSAFDLFGVWFLPHRVVAYLVLGLALLAGHAADVLIPTREHAVACALALAVAVAGFPAAAAAEPWMRYHDETDRAAITEAARVLSDDATARVIVVSWQSEQTLMAKGPWSQVRFDAAFFVDAEHRSHVLDAAAVEARPLFVLVDGYAIVAGNTRGLDAWNAAFLAEPPFVPVVPPPEGTVAGGLWRVLPA